MLKHSKRQREEQLERRSHIRFDVFGSLALDSNGQQYIGSPVNLSLDGILFRSDRLLPIGVVATLRLQIIGYHETISTEVKIVRTYETVAAATILGPHAAVTK